MCAKIRYFAWCCFYKILKTNFWKFCEKCTYTEHMYIGNILKENYSSKLVLWLVYTIFSRFRFLWLVYTIFSRFRFLWLVYTIFHVSGFFDLFIQFFHVSGFFSFHFPSSRFLNRLSFHICKGCWQNKPKTNKKN